MEKAVAGEEEFTQEAARFASALRPQKERATLITLSGELGAGKTTFVKAVARAFGVPEEVTSPTFVLLKKYPLRQAPFTTLVHVDAYRLRDATELAPLRLPEVMSDPEVLVMFEWPERVMGALPPASVSVSVRVLPNGARMIAYDTEG